MYVHSNRPVKFLLISVSMIVVGCAESPQAPISYNPKPITVAQNDNNSRPEKISGRLKTAQSHKNTIWERLLNLYALPEIDNERVQRELNWYLDHPSYIARVQQRAEPYLHLILDEIESNNIPGELALLPVVESAFIPDAYSKADASGLWQFIPDTGKLYGLEQSSWYDGRRDILDSTQAATAFLKDLGETFNGDWLLALASYNWGKGNVWKSIERNESVGLPTDYWSLDMPKETADYVPRLLAIAKLIANADEYGIHLNNIPNKRYLEVVPVNAPLDLEKAAQLAGMSYDKFMKLNPGFNRSTTAPDGPSRLLVPSDKAESFKTQLAQLPMEQWVDQNLIARQEEERARLEEERKERAEYQKEIKLVQVTHQNQNLSGSRYRVKSGDSLKEIAAKNHITVAALVKANPSISKSVRSGSLLKIPTAPKSESIQVAKATKNGKAEHIQLATISSAKKGYVSANVLRASKSSDKKALTVASTKNASAKSTDKKAAAAIMAHLPSSNKSQNYRKANVVVAELHKASLDTKVRTTGKKLKRT